MEDNKLSSADLLAQATRAAAAARGPEARESQRYLRAALVTLIVHVRRQYLAAGGKPLTNWEDIDKRLRLALRTTATIEAMVDRWIRELRIPSHGDPGLGEVEEEILSARHAVDPRLNRHLGRRLRQLQETRGLTTVDLAARLGVTVRTVYRHQQGLTPIPADVLARWVSALGANAEEVLRGASESAGAERHEEEQARERRTEQRRQRAQQKALADP